MPATRSGLSTVSELEPAETIALLCVFFEPAMDRRYATVPRPIDLPKSKFNSRLATSCWDFVAWVRDTIKYETAEADLQFYVPVQPTPAGDVHGWKKKGILPTFDTTNYEFDIDEARFRRILLNHSLAKVLGESVTNEDQLHLIVAATGGHFIKQKTGSVGLLKSRGDILPELANFETTVKTKCPTPSSSKSNNYARTQAVWSTAIFDGRLGHKPSAVNTIAPPLTLFHPIFERFLRLASDSSIEVPDDVSCEVRKLLDFVAVVQVSETNYASRLRPFLGRILGHTVREERNPDGTTPDGSWSFDLGGVSVPIMLMEVKRELAEGKCDPSVQAGLVARRTWTTRELLPIIRQIRCPTFLVTGGGGWLSISGLVFTDRFIAQPLTHMMVSWPTTMSVRRQVTQLSRIFLALRGCGELLIDEHKDSKDRLLAYKVDKPVHSKLFPYPNAFSQDGKMVEFEYVRSLQPNCPAIAFEAKIPSQGDKSIVVKFVEQYGEDVHNFLASQGHAPQLHYYGGLACTNKLYVECLNLPSSGGGGFFNDDWFMVVMDYVSPQANPTLPPDAKAQISAILKELHSNGYVFGDLREPNIVFDANGKVKLIDFDWSGRFDPSVQDTFASDLVPEEVKEKIRHLGSETQQCSYVRYPLGLSEQINWGGGKECGPIRPEYDWAMYNHLW